MKLKHVCLYAKGWYQRDNIYDDLRKCLTADDYSGEYFTDRDVSELIIRKCLDSFKGYEANILELMKDADPYQCWKVGYLHKDADNWKQFKNLKSKEVDEHYNYWKAFLYVCLSRLRFMEVENLPSPDENVLPLTKTEQ